MSGTSQKQIEQLGLPRDIKFWGLVPFGSLNWQDSRTSIGDPEFYWIENFLKIGAGRLRTLYDHGDALYTAPNGRTIICFFWFNIGPAVACAVFLDDGTAVHVAADGTTTPISATAGTFYLAGGNLPACSQSAADYLIIANNNTPNDYWLWDGTALYTAGTLSPVVNLLSGGEAYTSTPTITAFGGSGASATFSPTVVGGSVTNVQVTNPGTGYLAGETVQLQFSGGGAQTGAILTATLSAGVIDYINVIASGSNYTDTPTVTITGGGGSGATAYATVSNGRVTSVTVTGGGSGYTSTPAVALTVGTGATATATILAGAVTGFTIATNGAGYINPPAVSITGGGGTGAVAVAVLTAGSVTGLTLVYGGNGYTTTPTVAISAGSGASAQPFLSPGGVTSVTVVNGGTGFNYTPTLSFLGGGGSGATATAVVTAGVITSVSMVSGGSGYTRAPDVQISPGLNSAAQATVELMPFGVSAGALETFQEQVWGVHPYSPGVAQNGGTVLASGPGSVTDFSTAAGGVLFKSRSRYLRQRYVNLRQSNGYLYPLGNSSIDVFSGVTTNATSGVTTFNNQNTDPQTGCAWRDSAVDYGRTILFGNPKGVYGLYGGSVACVSDKLRNLFWQTFPPGYAGVIPSAAVADLFGVKCSLLLATITDPFTGTKRPAMLGWTEKEWFIASQSVPLTFIGTQEANSVSTAWGTDGTALYPLFQAPSARLTKILTTKAFGGPQDYIVNRALAFYMRAQDKSAAQAGIEGQILLEGFLEAEALSAPPGHMQIAPPASAVTMPVQPYFLAPTNTHPVWGAKTPDVVGTAIGATMTTTSPDFEIEGIILAYQQLTGIYSG